ncbi:MULTISPECIES: dual specificity protein phosphatase family protein [Acidianus]|uniref:Protein phosphatase n=1 Tax=Candidatus Acidianus copahuensis TaxID=1160895 RepID=A0A031LUI8_9CREN|nr:MULTISPECIES: dual specificity protein phosphatase family protein [Acidianus]EZQ11119.1 protein phosphatase [Candidatus Acidianus copahuensis]NON62504.1 protein phosphatase [Acidianus sp. RZ1]
MYWVRKGIIGGSSIPYTLSEISEWKSRGVRRVLVLPEDWEIEEAWGDIQYYLKIIAENGFEYLHEPISDGHAPTEEQFSRILSWLSSGKGNLVHCIGGIGRTGTIIAGYLMVKEGFSSREAVEEVRKYQPGSVQTLKQYEFLLRLEKWTTSSTF